MFMYRNIVTEPEQRPSHAVYGVEWNDTSSSFDVGDKYGVQKGERKLTTTSEPYTSSYRKLGLKYTD